MIGLSLVAAHMAGDYLFQSSRMAALKLNHWRIRAQHVTVYCACFIPVVLAARPEFWKAAVFLALLWVAHFATDSHRWRTSNPWPPMPILQDQSLHAVQLAVLGWLLV